MDITVRMANSDDLPIITKFNQNLFSYECQYTDTYNQGWPSSSEGQAYFAQRLNQMGGFVLVAEVDSKIIGYVAMGISMYAFRIDNPIAEVENMFVDHKLQRKGIGTKLMEKAEMMCKEKGVKRIKVETLDRNIPSLSFYNKHSFSAHNMVLEKEISTEKNEG